MNAKKAKAIRRAARRIGDAAGIDHETHYLTGRTGRGRGSFVVVDCTRGIEKKIKGMTRLTPNLPIGAIDIHGLNAAVLDTH